MFLVTCFYCCPDSFAWMDFHSRLPAQLIISLFYRASLVYFYTMCIIISTRMLSPSKNQYLNSPTQLAKIESPITRRRHNYILQLNWPRQYFRYEEGLLFSFAQCRKCTALLPLQWIFCYGTSLLKDVIDGLAFLSQNKRIIGSCDCL
jgi:hypothetical protein